MKYRKAEERRDGETLYTMVEDFRRIKRSTKRRNTSSSSMGTEEQITLKGDEIGTSNTRRTTAESASLKC